MKTKHQRALLAALQAAGGGLVLAEGRRCRAIRTVRSLVLAGMPNRVAGLHYVRTSCQIAVWQEADHPGFSTFASPAFRGIFKVNGSDAPVKPISFGEVLAGSAAS